MKHLNEYTDYELNELAASFSKIAIKRVTDLEEEEICQLSEDESSKLKVIIHGALLASRWNYGNKEAVQGILDYAEYMFNQFFPNFNGYQSVYLLLDILIKRIDKEFYVDEEKARRYIDEN